MTRRRAPRPAAEALRTAREAAAPRTPLAALQAVWPEVAGERLAAAARPVAERAGEATFACADPIWAEELGMMSEQLLERLRARMGEAAPKKLRFRVRETDE
jgi:predicted nucleic acid-binding Zn ribbon protein